MTGIEKVFWLAIADSIDQQELKQIYPEVDDNELFAFAVQNNAESIVGLKLKAMLGSQALPTHWESAVYGVRAKIAQYMVELDSIANEFSQANIPLVALKNSGIARGLFPDLAGSPMGDVDVLIDPAQFKVAHAIMLALGYRFASRSPLGQHGFEEAERDGGAEYNKLLADGSLFWFELQSRAVAGRWIRPDQEPKATDLIARSVMISGSKVRLLSPQDNLLQVCLHTAKHTFIRAPGIRLHTDVDRIVRRCSVNWEQLLKEIDRLQVRTAIYLSLRIPSIYLNTPIPKEVLQYLEEPRWKTALMYRWIINAGLFNPTERKFSKIGYICFNLLLYDNLGGVIRAIFPERPWMFQRYKIQKQWWLPFFYARRILELILKRAKT